MIKSNKGNVGVYRRTDRGSVPANNLAVKKYNRSLSAGPARERGTAPRGAEKNKRKPADSLAVRNKIPGLPRSFHSLAMTSLLKV